MHNPVTELKHAYELIQKAYDVLMGNPKLFIMLYVPMALMTFVVADQPPISDVTSSSISSLTINLILLAVAIMTTLALTHAVATEATTPKDAFTFAKKHIKNYLILWAFVTPAGLVCFIITNLFVAGPLGFMFGEVAATIASIITMTAFGVWVCFAPFILLFEEMTPKQALKEGFKRTRHTWLHVFILILALVGGFYIAKEIILTLATTVLSSLGAFGMTLTSVLLDAVLTPLALAFMYILYNDEYRGKNADVQEEIAAPTVPVA